MFLKTFLNHFLVLQILTSVQVAHVRMEPHVTTSKTALHVRVRQDTLELLAVKVNTGYFRFNVDASFLCLTLDFTRRTF